jgi:hypothetical protein
MLDNKDDNVGQEVVELYEDEILKLENEVFINTIDDTSIFTRTRVLNIKDQTDRSVHKEVGPKKLYIKSPIVTPR